LNCDKRAEIIYANPQFKSIPFHCVVIIGSYVPGGQMPFGSELTTLERARLYRRLVQDYFAIDDAKPGILKSWLMGKTRSAEKP